MTLFRVIGFLNFFSKKCFYGNVENFVLIPNIYRFRYLTCKLAENCNFFSSITIIDRFLFVCLFVCPLWEQPRRVLEPSGFLHRVAHALKVRRIVFSTVGVNF